MPAWIEIKAKYEAEYADLKTRLDGVKADWSDDRNSIIAQEANHMNGMDKIAAALEALNAEVKAANDKAVEESAAKEANRERIRCAESRTRSAERRVRGCQDAHRKLWRERA